VVTEAPDPQGHKAIHQSEGKSIAGFQEKLKSQRQRVREKKVRKMERLRATIEPVKSDWRYTQCHSLNA
jgi:hypothetical protein